MGKKKNTGHLPLYDDQGNMIRPSRGIVPQTTPQPKDRPYCEQCEHFELLERGRKHLVDTQWFKKMMNLYGDGSDWKPAHFGNIIQYSIEKIYNASCLCISHQPSIMARVTLPFLTDMVALCGVITWAIACPPLSP